MFGPSEKVQEISLSQESLDLIKGSSATLEVSAKPWTVVNRDCTWTSSDETVAKVENEFSGPFFWWLSSCSC